MVKNTFFNNKLLFNILIAAIALFSFFLFSSAYYPSVSSDMGVNVLIAESFSLPHDVYWWGQDRLGSFIPLISQPLIKMGMSSLLAVSISNYLVITLGFIGFSTLFKSKKTILLFAILWFFPYQRFIDMSVFPLGLSYGLLGFSLLFLRKIDLHQSFLMHYKNLIYILLTFIIWGCAVWISDLMFITLTTLGLSGGIYFLFNKTTYNKLPIIVIYLLGMAGIAFIILHLKTYAIVVAQGFSGINSITQVINAFNIVGQSIYLVLSFQDSFFISLGAWIILTLMLLTLIHTFQLIRSGRLFKNVWHTFFLADFSGILLVIFLSNWVLLNDMGRWYFVAPYISFSIYFLYTLDNSGFIHKKIVFPILSICFILLGTSPITAIYNQYRGYQSTASVVQELDRLGEIGIIGDYWNSYKLSIANPGKVKSTPHQHSDIKNPARINEVLLQPRIIVARDMWMDAFPDSLHQFGYLLLKKGNPFYLAKSNLCEYEISKETTLTSDQLNHNENGILNPDKTIQFAKKETINKHAVFGPNMPLIPGKYRAEFYITDVDIASLKDELIGDVTTNYGNNVMVSNTLNATCYDKVKRCFVLYFDIKNITQNQTEFRIYVSKSINFVFQKIVVQKMN